MASLKGVRGKIEWAGQHLNSIASEICRYADYKNSEAVIGESEVDGNHVLSVRLSEMTVPPSLPYLIGDCLQNLRTSLDYLIWELVESAGNVPSTKNQFPICEASDDFKSQLRRHRLDGISPDAVTEIEGLQSYQPGNRGSYNLLLVLDKLCNINKHRRLILTAGEPVGIVTNAVNAPGSCAPWFLPVGDLATDVGFSEAFKPQMKMKGISIHCVTFQESAVCGEEVCQTLGRIGYEITSSVIPRFERFFGE